jgi:DnaJ like chaperone protein
MASFANVMTPFFAAPQRAVISTRQYSTEAKLESASFTHALVALAAKLAAVDGVPNKAEYAAFNALFVENEQQAAPMRNVFLKQINDTSSALQYARQIAGCTPGDKALHLDLLTRLLRIATADTALNAAEFEMLRAIATILKVDRERFRTLVAQAVVPPSASPYEILGISPRASDQQLRDHYMARVQMLHPDRYQAAGASAETIAMLSDQLAAVNAAYQTVQKTRAKKSSRTDAPSRWWSRLNAKGAKVSST